MKNYFTHNLENKDKRPPLPERYQKKFVYSKQKYSSPEFISNKQIVDVNQNLLTQFFSPQSKRKHSRQQQELKGNLALIKKTETKDLDKIKKQQKQTQNINTKQRNQKNDSFYPIRTNARQNHHNFDQFENSPNKQSRFQKINYLKHKRINSEPQCLDIQSPTKRNEMNKKVRFNYARLTTNINNLKRQPARQLQKNRSPSILRNQCDRNRINSVEGIVKRRQITDTDSVHSVEVDNNEGVKQSNSNFAIQKKYDKILSNLKARVKNRSNTSSPSKNKQPSVQVKLKESQKYTDPLFPPTRSSLFTYQNLNRPKQQLNQGQEIKWIRINELFPNRSLVVYNLSSQIQSEIIIQAGLYGSHNLASAMNAIKNSKSVLNKMFQNQTVNHYGIYIVNIFQESTWKYVVIDDKIPVIVQDQNNEENKAKRVLRKGEDQAINIDYAGAFLNITTNHISDTVQIWPLLLQKAFSSYYTSYENFHMGNQVDWIEQMTGSGGLVIDYEEASSESQEYISKLPLYLKNADSFGLGEVEVDVETEGNVCLVPILGNRFTSVQTCVTNGVQGEDSVLYLNPQDGFTEQTTSYSKLSNLFKKIHLFQFNHFPHLVSSKIGYYKQGVKGTHIRRCQYSLRQFTLEEGSDAVLSIRQKEQRWYHNSSFRHEYMWVRAILVQRQFNGGFRWITGRYSNRKSINFQTFLSKGHYCLIIMPEWGHIHCHQLNFLLQTNIPNIKITQLIYDPNQQMIQKACTDLAQRQGKLSQVNPFICSYSYLNQCVGLIIENINNERTVGTVKVMRSINGLKAQVEIVPINKQFYQLTQTEKMKTNKKFKNNIVFNIPPKESFTVVLRMKGGMDRTFFKVFDFGN